MAITDVEYKEEETNHITNALLQNGTYMNPKWTIKKKDEAPQSNAINGVTKKIGRILRRYNLKASLKPRRKIGAILSNPKAKSHLEDQSVYQIPCHNCDVVSISQTNRRVGVRVEEHKNLVQKELSTSALMQHIKATRHEIDF